MRRPPNTALATTDCHGCGATIAKSLASEPCPKVRETAKNTDALVETFSRSFSRAVDQWISDHGLEVESR